MRWCSSGNDDGSPLWQAMMRFSMVVLSSLLLGMSCGRSLPSNIAALCTQFGFSGLAFYFSLEFVAYQRSRRRAKRWQATAERELGQRLYKEAKMARYHKKVRTQNANPQGRAFAGKSAKVVLARTAP